jgi:NADH dehydrogenase
VIVGGGFGGLFAARSLRRAAVEVTLIDRRNFHLFQPLLYQVATGSLSPANIATPLRSIVKRQKNCQVMMAEVTGLDVAGRQVLLADGQVPYDQLVIATGVRHNYFGHSEWEPLAPGLKTVEDATGIRARILLAFESAERVADPARVREWLSFVIVGGGPTGVELAGALAEIANHTLRHEFRSIVPSDAHVILVEGADRVLPSYPPVLSGKARESLVRLGVDVRTGARVTQVAADAVTVEVEGGSQRIACRTVLWAAGVQASPLGQVLAHAAGAPLDRAGRVIVERNLSVPGHPDVFVIGDLAHFADQGATPLPGIAPVAMQQGRYVARLIERRRRGESLPPFHYVHRGNMATIGRKLAVAEIGRLKFGGTWAWLAWLFIHLMNLVQFENRLLVLAQWTWNYFTRNRSARLITERAGTWQSETQNDTGEGRRAGTGAGQAAAGG